MMLISSLECGLIEFKGWENKNRKNPGR
jgi:hypothetical protein